MKLLFLFFIIIFCTACGPGLTQQGNSLITAQYNSSSRYYLIQKNDTLYEISKKFGTTVDDLQAVNKITQAGNLKEGQKIIIPAIPRKLSVNTPVFFQWPVKGKIIAGYGQRINNTINQGINIKTSSKELIKASADGIVIFSSHLNGWGDTLMLKHPLSFYTIYTNLDNITVCEGARVKCGDVIGKTTLANNKGEYVMHFEIRKQHLPQDPGKYLR
jgi:murein DD-endopeptidase MepM/ murein hydrolase activator NlpD